MSTIEKKTIPLTVKQINTLQIQDGKAIYPYSNEEVSTVSICAMMINKEDSTAFFEDSTGQIGIQVFSSDFVLEDYKYYHIFVTLAVDVTTNQISKYMQLPVPVEDFNLITSHMLMAYSWHLRQLHGEKIRAHKSQAFAASYGATDAVGMSSSSLMGLSAMGAMYGSGIQPAAGAFGGNQTPVDRLAGVIRSLTSIHPSGVPLHELTKHLNMPSHDVNRFIDDMKNEGTVYTTTDDEHILLAE